MGGLHERIRQSDFRYYLELCPGTIPLDGVSLDPADAAPGDMPVVSVDPPSVPTEPFGVTEPVAVPSVPMVPIVPMPPVGAAVLPVSAAVPMASPVVLSDGDVPGTTVVVAVFGVVVDVWANAGAAAKARTAAAVIMRFIVLPFIIDCPCRAS